MECSKKKPKGIQCPQCKKWLAKHSTLLKHQKLHLYSKFECQECGKTFHNMTHWQTHMNMHSGFRTEPCPMCGKTFTENRTLKMHLRLHTGERPYECPNCPEKFAFKGRFKRHLRTHTGERFSCAECGKEYVNRNSLVYHEKTHTSVKPFSCPVCNGGFTTLQNLDKHVSKQHPPEPAKGPPPKFICVKCGKGYMHQNSLAYHEKTHTGIKPHSCKICDRSFITRASMVRHVAKQHLKGADTKKQDDLPIENSADSSVVKKQLLVLGAPTGTELDTNRRVVLLLLESPVPKQPVKLKEEVT